MGNSEFVIEAGSGPASARPLLDSLRRGAQARWVSWLLGGLCVAALALALLLRLPDTRVLTEARELCAAAARLGWASAAMPAADAEVDALARTDALTRLMRARDALAGQLTTLQAAAGRSDIALPELLELRARWAALPALPQRPDAAALQALSDAADTVAAAAQRRIDERQRGTTLALQAAAALLAGALVLAIAGLWRQRRRLRASLHQISQHLGSGDWQDAVQSLREDRLGAPSAFDALASGVEGVLGESDRRWQALADLSADWYWETDARGRLSWLSGSAPAVTLLGWTPADMMGRRRDELPFLEAPAHGWTALHDKMDRHESFRDVEFRALARRGGHAVWVAISGRPRFDARGEFVGYEGVGRNITERKAAHERLIASEQRWSLMAGLASDWYWQSDAEHRLLPLAPELYRRVPAFAERIVGRTRWEAHADALSPEQWAEHRADLDAHRPFRSLQFEAETGDGRFLWLSISGIPRFDGQGRFLGYHGVGRDITVRKQAERLLLRHNEELQRAVAERTRDLEQLNLDLEAFSRQLAHELRTPISHVQGLAHLIETRAAGRLTGEERQLIALQVQAARNMRETVDALMLLARSTVQAMPMEAVDIGAMAVQVIAELPLLERRAPVQWQVEPGLQAWGSPAALRIVLANLMGNAAKFTRQVEAPHIVVAGSEEAVGRLRVSIRDNGAGFDPAQAARLFQPFQRLHAGDDFHGTGIGLTIVQRIVERHGGTVAAEGTPGQGACFSFTLARVPAEAAAQR